MKTRIGLGVRATIIPVLLAGMLVGIGCSNSDDVMSSPSGGTAGVSLGAAQVSAFSPVNRFQTAEPA